MRFWRGFLCRPIRETNNSAHPETTRLLPRRPAAYYVIGRPASAHTLADGVSAIGVRDLPAILAATPPSG